MMDDCPVVSIYKEADDMVVIKTGDGRTYDIMSDEYATGDWLVACDEENRYRWFLDLDSAMKYTLQELSVLKDVEYDLAPDRTSS